jgi:hypothetical protein
MVPVKTRAPMPSPWRVFLGILCIALVLLGGIVSLTHTHPVADPSHTDCSLCVTSHSVGHTTASPVLLSHVQLLTTTVAALPLPRARTLSRFALFTRPPPESASSF